MTEQEAIEELKCYRAQSGTSYPEEIEVAISALEEIQQYRKIGKPEELKRLKENGAFTGMELAQIAIMQMELKKYIAIGTPEECREAVEKQRAEKPTVSVQEKDLKVGCAVFAAGTKTYWCPSCRKMITGADKHCRTCGKKIDWSEEE